MLIGVGCFFAVLLGGGGVKKRKEIMKKLPMRRKQKSIHSYYKILREEN